jgi:hypothetical protein
MRQTQSEATDGENEQQDCGSNGFFKQADSHNNFAKLQNTLALERGKST